MTNEYRIRSITGILLLVAAAATASVPATTPDPSARVELLHFADQLREVPGIDEASIEEVRSAIAVFSNTDNAECARTELLQFIEQIAAVPGVDPRAAENARQQLSTAPDEAIVPLYAALEPVRGWQQLPAVMGNLSRQIEAQQAERVRRAIDAALDPSARTDALRSDLQTFVATLRAFVPLAGPQLSGHLDVLDARIIEAGDADLAMIRKIFAQKAEAFRYELTALQIEGQPAHRLLQPVTLAEPCDSICSDDPFGICDAICGAIVSAFNTIKSGIESAISGLNSAISSLQSQLNGLISQFNSLVGQVNGFINQIAGFVTSAFNATANLFSQIGSLVTSIGTTFSNLLSGLDTLVTGFFNDLIALIPTTPEAAFNLLTGIRLTGTAWVETLIARMPILDPPCPAIGTDIGPLGVMGSLGAAQKSDGFAKLTKILYDAAPKDVPGIKAKLAAAAIYHPAEYWNLCARSRYAIAQFELDTAHRAHQSANLDATLSTRATQTSANTLSGSLTDLDGDGLRVEGKVTALDPKANELLRRLDQPLSTRVRQTSVDDLRGTLTNLDLDVGKVESKLDILGGNVRQEASNESSFQSALESFETLMTRLVIEDNLLEESNTSVISLFQLPEAYGGHLGLVRSIVSQTVDAMLAAGERTWNAQKELNGGDALVQAGDFTGAYRQFRRAYNDAVKP